MTHAAVFFSAVASLVNPSGYVLVRPGATLIYTDPGSGALIVQLLTTAGLMAAFYFSRARLWVAKRLGFGTDIPQSQEGSGQSDDTQDKDS